VKAKGVTIAMQNETPNCRMAMFSDSEGNSVFLHQRKTQ
jgi:predicted enzyme related to lactoylglutathione lyase